MGFRFGPLALNLIHGLYNVVDYFCTTPIILYNDVVLSFGKGSNDQMLRMFTFAASLLQLTVYSFTNCLSNSFGSFTVELYQTGYALLLEKKVLKEHITASMDYITTTWDFKKGVGELEKAVAQSEL